jgi:prevent-host-death family protein
MARIDVHEAKIHLSRLIERAQAGEEIVIARAGTPIVRLVPVDQPLTKRRLGLCDKQSPGARDFMIARVTSNRRVPGTS